MGMGAARPTSATATGRGGPRPMPSPPMGMTPPPMAFLQGNYPGTTLFQPPMPPQAPMGMAAGGYIPQGDFGQSPYNMGMNQMDPYAPMPTYMGGTPPNMPMQAMAGGGTAGYMGGGTVGYSNGGVPQPAGLAALPLPRHYGL